MTPAVETVQREASLTAGLTQLRLLTARSCGVSLPTLLEIDRPHTSPILVSNALQLLPRPPGECQADPGPPGHLLLPGVGPPLLPGLTPTSSPVLNIFRKMTDKDELVQRAKLAEQAER